MESSTSVAEFFDILSQLPFVVKALPFALMAALLGRVIGNGDEEPGKRSAAYNVVAVLGSMMIAILASGYAFEERKVNVWASLGVAVVVGIGGVYIVIGIKSLFKGFAKRPESTLKKYWPFKFNPWEGDKPKE
ncbi:hypothetical protein GCM10027299_09410 [Larkinella ripae]